MCCVPTGVVARSTAARVRRDTPAGAVNAGTGDIVIVDADGTNARRVTDTGTDTHPVWSPDGRRLAFARSDNGLMNVFVVDIDGTHLKQVTTSGAMTPTWSPDGTRIAYHDMPGGIPDGGHIFAMDADGGDATELTHGVEETQPAWSPDGTRIAFQNSADSSIYTVRPDGTAMTRITTCSSSACSDLSPAWSPDSAQIVFDRSDGSRRQPYVVSSTGGGARRMIVDSNDDSAAWRGADPRRGSVRDPCGRRSSAARVVVRPESMVPATRGQ